MKRALRVFPVLLLAALTACAPAVSAPSVGAVQTLPPQTQQAAGTQQTPPAPAQTLPVQTPASPVPETTAPATTAPATAAPATVPPTASSAPETASPEPTAAPQTQAPATQPPQSSAPQIAPGGPVLMLPGAQAGSGSASAAPSTGTDSADLDAMALSDVMAAILKNVTDLPATMETVLEADRYASTAFVSYSDGMEALVSEPLINATAHSVVLLRVPAGTDSQTVAGTMAANMNPRKWICVAAEAASVTVRGNTILLVMSNETAEKQIVDNFNAL